MEIDTEINKKRTRSEDGDLVSEGDNTHDGNASLCSSGVVSISHKTDDNLSTMQKDKISAESNLERARAVARAARRKKREALVDCRARIKELLIERERCKTLVSSSSGVGNVEVSTVALGLGDAEGLISNLHTREEQEIDLHVNMQNINKVRNNGGDLDMTAAQLEALRKDRNRMHAKKARLKKKIISQELSVIKKKLEAEIKQLHDMLSRCYPSGVPDIDIELSPALARTFEKIDSLAKYGDSLVANAEPVSHAILSVGYHPANMMSGGILMPSGRPGVSSGGPIYFDQQMFPFMQQPNMYMPGVAGFQQPQMQGYFGVEGMRPQTEQGVAPVPSPWGFTGNLPQQYYAHVAQSFGVLQSEGPIRRPQGPFGPAGFPISGYPPAAVNLQQYNQYFAAPPPGAYLHPPAMPTAIVPPVYSQPAVTPQVVSHIPDGPNDSVL